MSHMILCDNGDGTYLGADATGALYDGVREQVGFDELTVTTTLAADGLSFERVTTHGATVIAKGTTTKDAFLAARGLSDAASADQDSAWTTECDIAAHQPVYVDALVNGEFQTVPKTLSRITWTAR